MLFDDVGAGSEKIGKRVSQVRGLEFQPGLIEELNVGSQFQLSGPDFERPGCRDDPYGLVSGNQREPGIGLEES